MLLTIATAALCDPAMCSLPCLSTPFASLQKKLRQRVLAVILVLVTVSATLKSTAYVCKEGIGAILTIFEEGMSCSETTGIVRK
jgi:hypothetical protein